MDLLILFGSAIVLAVLITWFRYRSLVRCYGSWENAYRALSRVDYADYQRRHWRHYGHWAPPRLTDQPDWED